MKTFTKLFTVLLFAFGLKADAQITYLKTFPHGNVAGSFQSIFLKHSGFKFVLFHSDTLSFYNLNLSLYENVKIPGNWGSGYYVTCISEGLFDTDSLHIDYLVQQAVNFGDSVVIYKDNGSVVYRNDSAYFDGGYYAGMQGPFGSPIISTDSGTFMSLIMHFGSANQLFKLPGSLPCMPGCSGDIATNMPVITNNANGAMSVYPNPAVSYTNINYTLPTGSSKGEIVLYDLAGRALKIYNVTPQVDHLQLTTSDIKAGTYFYQLSVDGEPIATKKIVVVR